MHFSFSTLNMLQTHSHCWINKIMGIKPEMKDYFTEGTGCHRIIQRHVSGVEAHPDLAHIKVKFPLVEEKSFDERLKFSFEYRGYEILGYYDGVNQEAYQFLEIKSSAQPWSLMKFKKAAQRKMYAYSDRTFKEAILITCPRDPKLWKKVKPKVCRVPITEKDYEGAMAFMDAGIDIFERGDFDGGLVDGRCTDPWCPWGKNCHFKKI